MEHAISRPATVLDSRPLSVALLALVTGLYLWLNADSLASMAAIWWRSETYAHGMLVPVISAWLIYRKRQLLTSIPVSSCWWALLPLAGSLFLLSLSRAADLQAGEQLASVVMLLSLVLLLAGWQLFSAFAFPLLYLLFAVPLGEELTPWLQQVTADISVRALQLTGIPVYVNGLFIEIPSGRFEVAEACSGIRYLIASLAVGTLYAYLTYERLGKRLLFALAAIVSPILANGIRAYLIIIIAHLSSMKYATGVDHLIYGWLFFGVVMLLLFWVGSFWADPAPAPASDSTATPPASIRSYPQFAALVVCIGALAATTLLNQRALAPAPQGLGSYNIELGGWTATDSTDRWQPQFINPDFSTTRQFNAPADITLYLADYHAEAQDKELINQLNRLYGKQWTLAGGSSATVDTPAGTLSVNQLDIRHNGGGQRLVWYWYQVDQHTARRGAVVKLYQALKRMSGSAPFSRVIAVSTPVADSNDRQAPERLRRFVQTAWPVIAPLR